MKKEFIIILITTILFFSIIIGFIKIEKKQSQFIEEIMELKIFEFNLEWEKITLRENCNNEYFNQNMIYLLAKKQLRTSHILMRPEFSQIQHDLSWRIENDKEWMDKNKGDCNELYPVYDFPNFNSYLNTVNFLEIHDILLYQADAIYNGAKFRGEYIQFTDVFYNGNQINYGQIFVDCDKKSANNFYENISFDKLHCVGNKTFEDIAILKPVYSTNINSEIVYAPDAFSGSWTLFNKPKMENTKTNETIVIIFKEEK